MQSYPHEITDDDIVTLRDEEGATRVELWTDGTWIRIGRDVQGDQFIELHHEELDAFIDLVDTQQSAVFKESFTMNKGYTTQETPYIFDRRGGIDNPIDIYRNRTHVFTEAGHESHLLGDLRQHVREVRRDFDPADIADEYVDHVLADKYDIVSRSQRYETEFVFEVVDKHTPELVHTNLIETLDDDSSVRFNQAQYDADHEAIVYAFYVDTRAVVDTHGTEFND